MVDQRLACDRAAPVDQVDDAFGHAGLLDQFYKAVDRQGRQFGRLDNAAVAEGNGRCNLHAGQRHRRVPRRHQRGDADRLANHVCQVARVLSDGLAADLAGDFGEHAEVLGGARDVHFMEPRHRQAGVQAFEPSQLIGMIADQLLGAAQHSAARISAHPAPRSGLEGSARGHHRFIDNRRAGLGQLGYLGFGGGVEHRQAGAFALPRGAGYAAVDPFGGGSLGHSILR